MVRSDRDDESFGRHIEAGRMPGLFAGFLEGCGIVAQYSISGIIARMALLIGGIALSLTYGKQFTTSSLSLGKALKKDCYVHTKKASVPSKAVPKTPFEIWTGRKASLAYFHTWGCQAETGVGDRY